MVFDFSKLNYDERQTLVLCAASGEAIQPLGFAYNVQAEIHFNELSKLTFDIPSRVSGMEVPHYEDVIGMMYILWPGIGLFVLANPVTTSDGIQEIKNCTAYSAEYEFTYKQLFLEAGTFAFYDPAGDNNNTIIGRILELMPSWSVGSVDEDLWAKYRTFDETTANVYDFMKGSIQESYQCVFDFDTLNRTISVRSMTNKEDDPQPVYLSHTNLIKELEIEEDTDNVFTCLEVSGAEGVDISSVNPLGNNKIYDLSYYMRPEIVGQELADKWTVWKNDFDGLRQSYLNQNMVYSAKQMETETAKAKLTALQKELSSLETQQSVYVEAAANGDDSGFITNNLESLKSKIAVKRVEISGQEDLVAELEDDLDELLSNMRDIVESIQFDAKLPNNTPKYFTALELEILDRYIKEDSMQETTFVIPTYNLAAAEVGVETNEEPVTITITGSEIRGSGNLSDGYSNSFTGGKMRVKKTSEDGDSARVLTGSIKKATIVCTDPTEKYAILSASLVNVKEIDIGEADYASLCVTVIGTLEQNTGSLDEETSASFTYEPGSDIYLTYNATEYQKRSVEWDLFDYAMDTLGRLAYPTNSFSIDCSNFLSLEEFAAFKNKLQIGKKIYLDIGNEQILRPYLIGATVDFEAPDKLELEFGDSYSCKDAEFKLTDLLDQSISAGKSADYSKYTASAWIDSGADNYIRQLKENALNAALNAVVNGDDQNVIIDESGIRLRKMEDGDYDPEQIWMINNNIVFTKDGWGSAAMAIGKVFDANLIRYEQTTDTEQNPAKSYFIDKDGTPWTAEAGEWTPDLYEQVSDGNEFGVVAPAIVGTLLAGNTLVIESDKKDGGVAAFRVDSEGARLYNSRFDLMQGSENNGGQISMIPQVGLTGGFGSPSSPLFDYDPITGEIIGVVTSDGIVQKIADLDSDEVPNVNFWLDMNGDAYFRGTVHATDGEFTGTVHATDGEFKGTVDATMFKLDGVDISNIFAAQGDPQTGELTELTIGKMHIDSEGNISFDGGTGTGEIKAIDHTEVTYGTSVSTSVYPTTWQETMPNAAQGTYIWTKTTFYYTDGTSTDAYSASYIGKNGSNGDDADVPNYIHSTYIGETEIRSPKITGNQVRAISAFEIVNDVSSTNSLGCFGRALGKKIVTDSDGSFSTEITNGVALAASDVGVVDGIIQWESTGHYVIATTAGVRMQANGHNITVTDNGAFYDGVEIGTGSGGGGSDITVTAVWG